MRHSGRVQFKRYRKVIFMLIKMFKILGRDINYRLLNLSRNITGVLGFLLRYIFLYNSAKSVGDNVAISPGVYFFNTDSLTIGNNVSINPMVYIDAIGGVTLGDFVSIAHSCSLISFDHSYNDISTPMQYNDIETSEILIENDVWLGCGVRILKGCTIETRVVIAAGSVVVKDVESHSIVGGVPAQLLKKLDSKY